MVRPTRPDQLLFNRRRHRHRHRRGQHAAATFKILIIREELQQFGGEEPEDQDPRIRNGNRRGDDRGAIIGKATERISSAEWYALVSANLGLLAGLIQIYQNRKDSPFETRPATMAISLAALCISIFAAAALLKSKSKAVKVEEEEQRTTGHFLYCRRIRDKLVLISGVLILSCVVSVFVPDGLGWIVFVSCASTISALVVGAFLFLALFGRTKSSHGESEPSIV